MASSDSPSLPSSDVAWTRLLRVDTGSLEDVSLAQMPPFIAISHTWAEALYPPGTAFALMPGARAIRCLIDQNFPKIHHCWVDTLCIDQADPKDKQRQIPNMGTIYGNAEAVAIVMNTALGLSQQTIDQVSESVEGAVDMYREESWTADGRHWVTGSSRQHLKQAMDCLEIFTRTPWATRVWTLQEFVLAKATVWIGSDIVPLMISEELFVAIPDVCETLNIEECIMGKYSVLYHYYRGMTGARLKQIDRTRVMELLGNRTASLPVDEVFGTMAASGVFIDELDIESPAEAWLLWCEQAIREGNIRWALLPPVRPTSAALSAHDGVDNCAIPTYSTRHLASSGSGLDTVTPLGTVEVKDGTVTMAGRWAGMCKVIRKLGCVHQDTAGLLHRDITLILFASNNWSLALRSASAFGGGRYTLKKLCAIAQILKHNYYRARLAVLSHTEESFRPKFRNQFYKSIWSDFMLLQSAQMMVMNEGVAYLAELRNETIQADFILVINGHTPSGKLMAIDFGAVTTSDRTLLTIVEVPEGLDDTSSLRPEESPPLHKVGVAIAMEIGRLETAQKFSGFALSDTNTYLFGIGGTGCAGCKRRSLNKNNAEVVKSVATKDNSYLPPDHRSRRLLRLAVRRQGKALRIDSRRRAHLSRTKALGFHQIRSHKP